MVSDEVDDAAFALQAAAGFQEAGGGGPPILGLMTEIIFLIEEDEEGGFVAEAVGWGVFTQADTIEELHEMVRDAVRCHFEDEPEAPRLIRLHFVRDEVIAA